MKASRFTRFMERLWFKKLCPQPDKPILGSMRLTQWLYNWTGKQGAFWHQINCHRCNPRSKFLIVYHYTSQENWRLIQKEGVLWGVRGTIQEDGSVTPISRCTYLAMYRGGWDGEVELEVQFDPETDTPNNYVDEGWQCRVYAPIPLDRVTLISNGEESDPDTNSILDEAASV